MSLLEIHELRCPECKELLKAESENEANETIKSHRFLCKGNNMDTKMTPDPLTIKLKDKMEFEVMRALEADWNLWTVEMKEAFRVCKSQNLFARAIRFTFDKTQALGLMALPEVKAVGD